MSTSETASSVESVSRQHSSVVPTASLDASHDAAIGEADPDARILRMLGARGTFVPRNDMRRAETDEVTAA